MLQYASGGGGWLVWGVGGSAPGGGAWSWVGVVCLVQGGVCSQRMPGPGGVSGLGGWCAWSGGVSQHALRQTPLPPVDRHTLVKTLPWPNFVAAGKNRRTKKRVTATGFISYVEFTKKF